MGQTKCNPPYIRQSCIQIQLQLQLKVCRTTHQVYCHLYHLWLSIICVIVEPSYSASNKTEEKVKTLRDSKVFSLFSIVTFKNTGCRSQSALASGQRYLLTEIILPWWMMIGLKFKQNILSLRFQVQILLGVVRKNNDYLWFTFLSMYGLDLYNVESKLYHKEINKFFESIF